MGGKPIAGVRHESIVRLHAFWDWRCARHLLLVRHHVISEACIVDTSDVPTVGGFPRAEVVWTSCYGFGASDVVEVFIRTNGDSTSGTRKLAFKYDPSSFSGPVQLSWVGPSELSISVARVDVIEVQETQVFGYNVSYHIGAVGPKTARLK
jgi:hypothetical protein